MTPLQIGLIIFVVILIIAIVVIVAVSVRKSRTSGAPAVPQNTSPVPGSPAYIPPASTGAPPSPVYVDPYPTSSYVPTTSPPLPTGTQPTLPPVQPPVYQAPAPAPTKPQPSQKPVLYRGSNLQGDAWEVPGLGKWAVANSRVRNDASSMKVPTGWKITVFDKDDCTGTNATYFSDVMDFGGTGLNNDIACVNLELA